MYYENMPNTTFLRNTINHFNSNNIKMNTFESAISVAMILIMMISTFAIALFDKTDKKPVLPFTTHDTCTSSSISISPTYGRTIRRVSSSEAIIASV